MSNKINNMIDDVKTFTEQDYNTRKSIIMKIPKSQRAKLYASQCSEEQLKQLFNEWDKNGDDKLKMLVLKRLQRKRPEIYENLIKLQINKD